MSSRMMARTRRGFLRGLTIAGGAAVGRSGVGTARAQETQIGASRMDQYDPANTGYASNETGPQTNPQELWRYDAEAALFGSPAIVDGVAYVATETGTVHALDAVSGTERWAVSLGEEILASPVIADRTVYVTAGESLYALSVDDGSEQWVEEVGADPSSPIVADGLVAVAGGNSVYVFSPGGESAAAELRGDVVSTPAIDGSTMYVATDAGTVYAFDIDRSDATPTITEGWIVDTLIDRRPTVSVADDTVIVTGPSPGEIDQGRVYAVDTRNGETQWEYSITAWIESAPAIDDDTVYVGTDNGDVVALELDSGAERWRFDANDAWSFLFWGPGVPAGVVVTDDTVYVGGEDGNLYAIDAGDGSPRWQFSTGDAIAATPTVVDGIAFVGNTDGALYAITSPDTSPVPLDSGTGSEGTPAGQSDQDTGDGGFIGFSLPGGVWGLITSPVTLLALAIGLLYGVASVVMNGTDGDDTAETGPTVTVESEPVADTASTAAATTGTDTGDDTPSESSDSAASASPGGEPAVSTSDDPRRGELLDELRELDEKWSAIDRTLLYSVGDHHPDEYEDAFGSLDNALAVAGITDTDTADDDTGETPDSVDPTGEEHTDGDPSADAESETESTPGHQIPKPTDGDPTDTTATPAATGQAADSGSTDMTDLSANELAELYTAFDRFQRLLTDLADELDTDGTTPMEQWAEAVADHWGGSGPVGAPNYGAQQRDRNDFSIREYRDVHGDGDRVTDFEHVEFAPADDRIQHLLGDAVDDWDHVIPVAPESNTPLPVAIASTEALEAATELLDEFPAYPNADRPAPDETAPDTDDLTLPDGRIDSLTVTVLDHDPNPGSKRDARLQVELEDGTEMPLDIWTTHDLALDWTIGDTYTITQARHKSWEASTGTGHQLSSTKDFRATPTDVGSANTKPDVTPPERASDRTDSNAPRTRDTATNDAKSTSNSGTNAMSGSGTPGRGELLDAIQRVAETIDRPLKAGDVSDKTEYSVNDVTRVFGSWQNGLEAAGIDNEARLIADLHRVAEELGHRPTTTEMNEHGHVSATTYATYFGTYTDAIEQAFDDGEYTRSTAGTTTPDHTHATDSDTGADTETGAATTEPDSGGNEQENADNDETTGTSPDDDGILGDIMNDFDEFSESEAE